MTALVVVAVVVVEGSGLRRLKREQICREGVFLVAYLVVCLDLNVP
jgi:hypothetical protein